MELTQIERAAIEKVLSGDHPSLVELRKQINGLSVKTRDSNEAGVITELTTAPDTKPASLRSERIQLGDVFGRLQGLKRGCGFLLFVENGFLKSLESYSFEEPWPKNIVKFELDFVDGREMRLKEKLG